MDIKAIRTNLGLSQLAMAELIGVSREHLAKAEAKIRSLNHLALTRLREIDLAQASDNGSLSEEVEIALQQETEKIKRRYDLLIENKQAELQNVIEELEKMRSNHIAAKKSLKIFSEEINIFRGVPSRKKKLMKIYENTLHTFLSSAPCYQQILEVRIESLQKFIEKYLLITGG
ncbi:MAG: helix-turn-helix domain-containing protein [Flavobacteriales bacterium]